MRVDTSEYELIKKVPEPSELAELDEDDFSEFVSMDLKHELDPEESKKFRHPEVVPRWRNTLIGLRDDLNNQLESRSADVEAGNLGVTEYRRWKPGALRFRGGVMERITEANGLMIRQGRLLETLLPAVTTHQDSTTEELLSVIRSHKNHVCTDACDDEGCPADEELWHTLEKGG